MGFLDKAKDAANKAKGYAEDHTEQVKGAIDKAGESVDRATKGKYSDKIDKAQTKAGDAVDKLNKR